MNTQIETPNERAEWRLWKRVGEARNSIRKNPCVKSRPLLCREKMNLLVILIVHGVIMRTGKPMNWKRGRREKKPPDRRCAE